MCSQWELSQQRSSAYQILNSTFDPGIYMSVDRKHEDLCVIWVDAHADINTISTTLSGKHANLARILLT